MYSDRPVGGASLLFQLLLLSSVGWSFIWLLLTVSLLGYKGDKLFYSTTSLVLDIISCVLTVVVNIFGFRLGVRGNLTEEIKTIAVSLLFFFIAGCGAFYFMWFQSYVMKLDLAFSACFLGINVITVIGGIWAIRQASLQALAPSYLVGVGSKKNV